MKHEVAEAPADRTLVGHVAQALFGHQLLPGRLLVRHVGGEAHGNRRPERQIERGGELLPDPPPPERLVYVVEGLAARGVRRRSPKACPAKGAGICDLGEHALVDVRGTRETERCPFHTAQGGVGADHHGDVHGVTGRVADHHVGAQDRPRRTAALRPTPQHVLLREVEVRPDVARVLVLVERCRNRPEVDAIDLRALIQDHALQRRADGVQPVEEVAQHRAVQPILFGEARMRRERGVEQVRRILGLREGGAGRVWIGEIRRDVPARSVRSTREGTRVPTVRCREFLHQRLADDAIRARNQGPSDLCHHRSRGCRGTGALCCAAVGRRTRSQQAVNPPEQDPFENRSLRVLDRTPHRQRLPTARS